MTAASDSTTPILQRNPAEIAVLSDVRHSEMRGISTRLGRLCNRKVDSERGFAAVALILFGGLAGGVFGAFPLWAASPSHQTKVYYLLALSLALLLGVVCLIARLAVRIERIESIEAIKDDLDEMLGGYTVAHVEGASSPNPASSNPIGLLPVRRKK